MPIIDMVSADVSKRIASHAGVLRWHGIDCELHGDRLMALEVGTIETCGEVREVSSWTDVTDFSSQALYRWLGY